MKETASHPIVIVLTEHPTWGVLLMPYLAEKTQGDDELRLLEQAFHASPEVMAGMTDAERKAIEIASHYTEKYLMQVYSHENTLARFLHKLSKEPEKIKNVIRPYIDKKLSEMVELILTAGFPLYQKQGRSNQLYAHHAYHINLQPVETAFRFELDGQSFSYQPTCTHEGHPLSLSEHKPVVVLTSEPATLLLGMELYTFRHMEAPRLLPFTKRARVTVDATHLQKYIDNIIIPIAGYHEISTSGLDIAEEQRVCEPLLNIEETIYEDTLLHLLFRYTDQTFAPEESPDKKNYMYRETTDNGTAIRYFRRDKNTEKQAIQMLKASGLEPVSDSLFKLSPSAPEKNLTQWISRHRVMLQTVFQLTSASQQQPYCLDEIHIEQSYGEEGPDWFELRITVVVGEFRIPFKHFRKHILEENHEYTLPNGEIILLPKEWFSKYMNLLEMGEEQGKTFRLKRAFVGIAEDLLQEHECLSATTLSAQQEFTPPRGLKAQLRPYQQKGFAWLQHLNEQNFGGCLADDMGLGKTLQTLTLLQHIYQSKAITTDNKDIPAEETNSLNDTDIETPKSADEYGQFSFFDTLLTENTVRTDLIDNNKGITNRKPGTLIVVPTSLLHNWKREARRFTSLTMAEYNSGSYFRKGHPEQFFDRYHLVFTTYGMMRNNIDTLRQYCFEYVILDESQNIKNGDSLTFRSAIQLCSHHRLVLTGTPIENSLKDLWAQFYFLQPELLGDENAFNKHFIAPIRQGANSARVRLRQLITPFILRRSKHEVAPELPPLTEEMICCSMTDEQNILYQQEKNSLRNILLQLNGHQERHQSLTVLNGISRLRQLACHPSMISPDFIGSSGKLEQIIDTFETLRSEGHKVLIFSSFVKHLKLIAAAFQERQWPYALLTGSSTNRPEEIARFTQTEEIQAFLISLKAGGVGLNLTQADYVFIIDPWWNPAAEAQAIARAHRIGQNKQVIAYRFITQGSIEEKIIQLQEGKRKLAETFITDSESFSSLTDKEWVGLLD